MKKKVIRKQRSTTVGMYNLEFAAVGHIQSIFIEGKALSKLCNLVGRYKKTQYKPTLNNQRRKIDQRCRPSTWRRRHSPPRRSPSLSTARKGLPIITPILQLRLLCAHDISVPVESFKIAITNSVTSCVQRAAGGRFAKQTTNGGSVVVVVVGLL